MLSYKEVTLERVSRVHADHSFHLCTELVRALFAHPLSLLNAQCEVPTGADLTLAVGSCVPVWTDAEKMCLGLVSAGSNSWVGPHEQIGGPDLTAVGTATAPLRARYPPSLTV